MSPKIWNPTSRRHFLKAGATTLAASLVSQRRFGFGQTVQRPNVLIVLSDQETELIPRSLLNIPNRAALEQNGIRFTQAICAAPQCSASRASIMTGLYPHQAGVVTNVDISSLGRPLSAKLSTIGHVFRAAGYATGYLGKWHLGNEKRGLEDYGFSGFRLDKGRPLDGDALAEAASSWISQQSSRPWLLVASFQNPHTIYSIPKRINSIGIRPGVTLPTNFSDTLEQKPLPQNQFLAQDQGRVSHDWNTEDWLRYRSYYLTLIERVDQNLGTIVSAIKLRGDSENTVVVYSSDHGDMGGSHRLPFKGPFMYDELLRVPLMISYPQLIHSHVVSNSQVSSIDILPTLASLAGIQAPDGLSGKDLSSLLEDPRQIVHASVFPEYYAKQHFVNPIRTIRTDHWKYNVYVAPGQVLSEELYRLGSTQGEVQNLAGDREYAQIHVGLHNNLLQWRQETHDPLL